MICRECCEPRYEPDHAATPALVHSLAEEPATLDDEAKTFLQRGLTLAMEWAVQGLVVPHVGRTIDSTVEMINAGLRSLKTGTGTLGKVAVIVDRDLAEGSCQGRFDPA